MDRRTREKQGVFVAHDEDGNEYRLVVYGEFQHVETFGGSEKHEVMKAIETVRGDKVNRVEKGRYQIAATGVELSSDDAGAP